MIEEKPEEEAWLLAIHTIKPYIHLSICVDYAI